MSQGPFDKKSKSYNAIFLFSASFVLLTILALNYFIDPYLIHQWDTRLVQRLRPTREQLDPWAKTYAVARYKPEIIYLGSSRTETGLPTDVDFFPGRRLFNAAITGGSLGDAIAMLEHAGNFSRLQHVVWGIDYFSFATGGGNSDFSRELVAHDDSYFFFRTLLNIKRSLSADMSIDTFKILAGTFGDDCRSSLAFRGQRDPACAKINLKNLGGAIQAVQADVKAFSKPPAQYNQAMPVFQKALERFCQQQTVFNLYINPTHAVLMDSLYWTGQWDLMEDWKRTLTKTIDTLKQLGCQIKLTDFSGFNSITTEPLPQVTGLETMRNYWEASHYRSHVGKMILERLFLADADKLPADFGVELNPTTIEAYLAAERRNRDAYHESHQQQVELIKQWVK